MSLVNRVTRPMQAFAEKQRELALATNSRVVRAFRMGLAQLVGELAVAIIITAILFGGIAGGIFFQANTTGWDATSKLVWPYIFPIALTAILMGIIWHMYQGVSEGP